MPMSTPPVRRVAPEPNHPPPVKTTPSSTRRMFLPTGMGSRIAFALYAMAMLGALGAITALIERAAS
jgi:hypothetical protein